MKIKTKEQNENIVFLIEEQINKRNIVFYLLFTLLIVFSLFLYFKIDNIGKKIKDIQAKIEPQQQPSKEVSINDVKQLFNSGFIYFGSKNNKLLIVEVSDPSCPFCHIAGGKNPELARQTGRFQYVSDGGTYLPPLPEIKKLIDSGKASFAFLYSNGHGNGQIAAESLYCAYEKGKFWEVHDKLMTNEGYNIINEQVANDRSKASILAEFLSDVIDKDYLSQCLNSAKYEKDLARDQKLSPNLGFQGTPHFLINTKMFQGAYSYTDMKSEIEKYL